MICGGDPRENLLSVPHFPGEKKKNEEPLHLPQLVRSVPREVKFMLQVAGNSESTLLALTSVTKNFQHCREVAMIKCEAT